MIRFEVSGGNKKLGRFLREMKGRTYLQSLEGIAQAGVAALASATPSSSGKTANSWSYSIQQEAGKIVINWNNSNINQGVPIALILQYGHGTGTGGYVQGRDYINPAMRPVFDRLANKAWEAITNA